MRQEPGRALKTPAASDEPNFPLRKKVAKLHASFLASILCSQFKGKCDPNTPGSPPQGDRQPGGPSETVMSSACQPYCVSRDLHRRVHVISTDVSRDLDRRLTTRANSIMSEPSPPAHTMPDGETSTPPQFEGLLHCALTFVCLLMSISIIVGNIAVLRRVGRTGRSRDRAHFSIANLARSDLLSGCGLLAYTAAVLTRSSHHRVMQGLTFLMFSQVMSALGLTLMSLNSYLAIKCPIFVFVHAEDLNRYTGILVASLWLVLPVLFSLPVSMGWNCLDAPTQNCFGLFHSAFVTAVTATSALLACVVFLTNLATFIAIGNRPKRITLSEDERRESEASEYRAKTVMIHAGVAFFSWIVPRALVVSSCHFNVEDCPMAVEPGVLAVLMVFNSAINPIASLTRTQGISIDFSGIRRVLATLMPRGRVHPQQDEAPVDDVRANLDSGAASGSEQKMSGGQTATGHTAWQEQQESDLRKRN
ncbi:Gamma-tubulin complex component 5 [Branchiostoma belcheri]|nr:Gamma-tubulin complex component 5 [Branchiostoma belcheri]